LFKQHELNLLIAFANQAGVAIENARLFENLQRQLAQVTEARDLMSNIFTSIPSGVLTVNRDYIIMDCNTAAERIIGRPREHLLGRSLDDILPSLNGAFHERLDRARSEGTRELMEVEPEMDGQHRYWNVIMSPLRDENLVAQGVAIVLRSEEHT